MGETSETMSVGIKIRNRVVLRNINRLLPELLSHRTNREKKNQANK